MGETKMVIDTSDPEEVSNFVIKQGNGVKGLADLGIPSLPKQYIHPLSERPGSFTCSPIPIPIIALAPSPAELQASVCSAAKRFGFFQVINHGVPLEVLERVKEAAFRFFELPVEEKRKYLKENSRSNNVRYGSSFNPDMERPLEWKDYLSLFFVSNDEALALWPSPCRDEVLDYMKKCEVLINTLVCLLMEGLGIPSVDTRIKSVLTGSRRINLNYYPKCPNPDLTVGVGRHSDVSTLTILLQDHLGGLYVHSTNEDECQTESWIHVPPLEGALVINVGDVLQMVSNGTYNSVQHWVVPSGSGNHISVPIFVSPSLGDVIGLLDQVLVKNGEKPKYKQVLYSDYALYFFRGAHNGKDTSQYATI